MEKTGYTLSGYHKNRNNITKNNIILAGDDLDYLKNMGERLKEAMDYGNLYTSDGAPYDRLEIMDKENGILWSAGYGTKEKCGEEDYQNKRDNNTAMPPEERYAMEKKLKELMDMQSVIGLEWYPDKDRINELEHEIRTVSAVLMRDNDIRGQELEEEIEM